MWNGSVDWSGRVGARIFTQWHPRFGTKINTQFSGDISQTHIQVEGNYKGKVILLLLLQLETMPYHKERFCEY